MTDPQRHCIVTAADHAKLVAEVQILLDQGWEKLGDIAMAKSAKAREAPYYCQSMVLRGALKLDRTAVC